MSPRNSVNNIKHEENKHPSVVVTPPPAIKNPNQEVERVRTPSPKSHEVKDNIDEIQRPKAPPQRGESPENSKVEETKVAVPNVSLQKPTTAESQGSNAGEMEIDSETANESLNTTVISIDRSMDQGPTL